MIVTDKVVFLNYPKTGSTFVRKQIKRIHRERFEKSIYKRVLKKLFRINVLGYKELLMQQPDIPDRIDQHGRYYMIPHSHIEKKIVSVVRNPYSRFLSIYKFKDWQTNHGLTKQQLEHNFPNFPDLTMDDFVKLKQLNVINFLKKRNVKPLNVGFQTIQFIDFFFRSSPDVMKKLTDNYLEDVQSALIDFPTITLLQQENLNDELHEFLLNEGYKEKEIGFIQDAKKVNQTKSSLEISELTPNAIAYIESSEKFLFSILKMRGINYER